MGAATATAASSAGQDGEIPSWPVPGLERRLRTALDFASVAVESFGEAGYVDEERPALSFRPEKVLAEAAMLAHAAQGSTSGAGVEDRLRALIAQLEPHVRSAAALADMAIHPDQVFKRAVPHVLLHGLGSVSREFDDFAADRCEAVVRHASDQPATVMAERRWLASLWPRLRTRTGAPAAGAPLDLPHDLRTESREDAYGLTHTLFYETDFGRRPPSGAVAARRDAVLVDVEGLLARYLDQGDYDLLGELLMAWPELRVPWSPAAAFTFGVLAHVEDEVGVLPCGNVDPVRLAALSGAGRTRYARAASYHTALVMGFLSAATLRTALPLSAGPAQATPSAWKPFRALVDESDTSQWLDVFDDRPHHQRDALAPLVRDLALAQAMRHDDVARAGELLATATRLGMPSSAMERAATDWLWAIHRAMELSGGTAGRTPVTPTLSKSSPG